LGLRPARVVNDPHGNVWELYTTRAAMPPDPNAPDRYQHNTKLGAYDDSSLASTADFVFVELVELIFVKLPRSVFRYFQGVRSGAVRIEAISFYPGRETRYWTTTPDQLRSVLDEIAAGIAEGRIPQPTGAVYVGTREE
jgi:hypothetical protein